MQLFVRTIHDPASQRLTWQKPPQTVLVVRKICDSKLAQPFAELVTWLITEKQMTVLAETAALTDSSSFTLDSAIVERVIELRPGEDVSGRVDLIVCLGGDGTLLHASSLFQQSVPPIVAFHLGSLGFLTPFKFVDFRSHINTVLEGSAALTLRSRLRCVLSSCDRSACHLVLNEVVVDRGPSPYLSDLDLFIDSKHITTVKVSIYFCKLPAS